MKSKENGLTILIILIKMIFGSVMEFYIKTWHVWEEEDNLIYNVVD